MPLSLLREPLSFLEGKTPQTARPGPEIFVRCKIAARGTSDWHGLILGGRALTARAGWDWASGRALRLTSWTRSRFRGPAFESGRLYEQRARWGGQGVSPFRRRRVPAPRAWGWRPRPRQAGCEGVRRRLCVGGGSPSGVLR